LRAKTRRAVTARSGENRPRRTAGADRRRLLLLRCAATADRPPKGGDTMRVATVAAFAAFAFAASPAAAIDNVTGTYEGKMTCRQIASGATTKVKQDVTVDVFEGKSNIGVDVGSVSTAIGGVLVEDTAKTDRAKLVGVECGVTFLNTAGGVLHADVVIKPGSDKGTIKGTLIVMDEFAPLGSLCTFTAKRTSTAEPDIEPCL
jgi:hypothetical protein